MPRSSEKRHAGPRARHSRRSSARRPAMAAAVRELGRIGRKPKVDLRRRRQNHRHGLGMDWRDDGVGLRREEGELMLALYRRALRPRTPRQGVHRPAKANSGRSASSANHLASCAASCPRIAKRRGRDDAADRSPQPAPPMSAHDVADVRDRRAAELRRGRASPNAPAARGRASCDEHTGKQNHCQEHADDREQEADADALRLPPKNVR